MDDIFFMEQALALAREAFDAGEVPVGCVVVRDGAVIGRGSNRREEARHALCHAELIAIDEACRALSGWRLVGCTLYVTLEPCAMCAGAMVNARLPRLCYGAADARFGAVDSRVQLFSTGLNHTPEVTSGVLARESADLLTAFFKRLRT